MFRPQWRSFKKYMMERQRLLWVVTLLIFNILFQLIIVDNHERPEITSPGALPSRFFHNNSSVLDLPFGNEEIFKSLPMNDAVFVMFYAPWSVPCKEARKHFEMSSSFYSDKVQFVAMNCWYSLGTCRKKRVFTTFPVFYFYFKDLEGFRYMGIPRADHMIKFVELMLNPIEVVNSNEQLINFLSTTHEISVVSFFNFASTVEPLGFDQFYMAALKSFESDPGGVLRFAMTTNATVASHVSLTSVSSISLVSATNYTHTFSTTDNTTAEDILQWVNSHKGESSMKWLHLAKRKSLVLSNELKKGPALLLFIPHFPLSITHHEDLAVMRKVAYMYYNCNRTEPILQNHFNNLSLKDYQKNEEFYSTCRNQDGENLSPSPDIFNSMKQKCCMYIIGWKRNVCIESDAVNLYSFHLCGLFNHFDKHSLSLQIPFLSKLFRCTEMTSKSVLLCPSVTVCFEMQLSYSSLSRIIVCSGSGNGKRAIPENRLRRWIGKHVERHHNKIITDTSRIFSLQQRLSSNGWLYNNNVHNNLDVSYYYPNSFIGNGCFLNQSVRFYALDSVDNEGFLSNLGFESYYPPVMFLVDIKNEVLYKFDSQLTESAIVNFVEMYENSSLVSHFRNKVTYYSKKKPGRILQVSSSDFDRLVLNNDKDVLLLHYSIWCGFCSMFSHVFVSMAEFLQSPTHLVFARMNADVNDVSTKHSAPYYPAMVLYLAKSNESIPYPKHFPMTFPSMMRFVQHFMSKKERLYPFWNTCNLECISLNKANINRKISKLHQQIKIISLELLTIGRDSSDVTQHKKDYEHFVRRELFKKTLQHSFARFLRKILDLPVTGRFLERHKISLLIERKRMLRTRLKNF